MNRQKALLIRTVRPVVERLRRWRAGRRTPVVHLDSVRRRLEILLAAMYGFPIRIDDAESASTSGWLGRMASGTPRHLASRGALAASDAESIRLPSELPDPGGTGHAVTQYRLLAIEHAERIARRTAALAPGDDTLLERDLYLLAEAAAIDSRIARSMHGMTSELDRARTTALANRPRLDDLTPTERAVELIAQGVLTANPVEPPAGLGVNTTPEDSLAWARSTAAAVRDPHSHYRGLAPISVWGRVRGTTAAGPTTTREEIVQEELSAAATLHTTIQQESGAGHRASEGRPDKSNETAEASEDIHDTGAEIEHPDGTIERGAEDVNDQTANATLGDLPSEHAGGTAPPSYTAVAYPEWDTNAGQYIPRRAIVRAYPPREGGSRWADDTLMANAAIVRQVRQRFERLRARRVRLRRQRDGDELDLDACVGALVDRRMGRAPDDDLYIQERPARRALAIALLVDSSGSTDTPVSDGRRVIDVEKIALLMASEALDALGDRYAILTFASDGAADVRVTNIKDFAERNGETVRRRISAIVPDGNTRLGAAVRHATALLEREPAGHRLLLVLSDGKPQDVDRYFPKYAVEDSRQAVMEARTAGVYPFCLTVDPEDPEEYVSHIFGTAGHTILRRADHLPQALLHCVRQLLGAR